MEVVKPRADAQKPQGCNTLRLLARKNPLRVRLFGRAGSLTLALDYAVALVVSGNYMIIKKASGEFYYWDSGSWSSSNPSSWPSSSHLNTGYGNTNNIKVVNAGSGNFYVSFNGVYETSFVDTAFTGGYNGYAASISSLSHEDFPTVPVDVRIKLISAN